MWVTSIAQRSLLRVDLETRPRVRGRGIFCRQDVPVRPLLDIGDGEAVFAAS